MSELQRWSTRSGAIVVEADEDDAGGYSSVVRRPGDVVADVKGGFDEALENFRDAAASALRVFRDQAIGPDEVTVEFGLKLNAGVGVVLAKAATEAHLVVKLTWSDEKTAPDEKAVPEA